jgi:hypothetical protein
VEREARQCNRAYAKRAKVILPALESYEREAPEGIIVPLPIAVTVPATEPHLQTGVA